VLSKEKKKKTTFRGKTRSQGRIEARKKVSMRANKKKSTRSTKKKEAEEGDKRGGVLSEGKNAQGKKGKWRTTGGRGKSRPKRGLPGGRVYGKEGEGGNN